MNWHRRGQVGVSFEDSQDGGMVYEEEEVEWLDKPLPDEHPREDLQKLSEEELRTRLQAVRQGRITALKKKRGKKKKRKKMTPTEKKIADLPPDKREKLLELLQGGDADADEDV